MTPMNLKEFAESLRLGDNAEYGLEILDLLEHGEGCTEAALLEELDEATPEGLTSFKAIEWLLEQRHILDKIGEDLKDCGYYVEGKDTDDTVLDLMCRLDDCETFPSEGVI